MQRNGAQRILPVAIILIVIAIAIAALVSIGRAIFGGGDTPINEGKQSLINTSDNRSVRMIVRGPIVAEEDFRTYQITVSNDNRTMVAYQGYLETPLQTVDLDNNNPAYEEFVYALDRANMMTAEAFKGESDDIRGICSNGRLYQFDTLNGGTVVKRLWTTSCKNVRGSLKTNVTVLRNLFNRQIPGSSELIQNANL